MAAVVHYVHANAIVIDGSGILIRGVSKSGKSTLALALIDAMRRQGHQALLVGDDRIGLRVQDGRLIASGHPQISGKIEVRGVGIIDLSFAAEAPVNLVVDLVFDEKKLISDDVRLFGIEIARLKLPAQTDVEDLVLKVLKAQTRN